MDVLLNGVSVGATTGDDDFAFHDFTITSGFVLGENTLEFRVNNHTLAGDPPTGNPTGLRVEFDQATPVTLWPPVLSLPTLFGTGVDDNGHLLDGGRIDPHFRLLSSPDPSFAGPTTFVLPDAWPIAQAGPWVANDSESRWLSVRPDNAGMAAPGDHVYETTFDIGDYNPDELTVSGEWASDNNGVDILINGQSTGYTTPFDNFQFHGFRISDGFVSGLNTIAFVVRNGGDTANPTGLRVRFDNSDAVTPASAPAHIPTLFNSGVDDSGNLLAGGATDPHFQLIGSPSGVTEVTALPSAWPIAPFGPWAANGPDSIWLGPADGALNALPGLYTYRTTFTLTSEFDPANLTVSGEWASDNDGVDIRINGRSTGYTTPFADFAFHGFRISDGFVAGENTLDFVVRNGGDSSNPTGFRVRFDNAVNHPPIAVDDPDLVTRNSPTVLLDVLYNDTSGADLGETLSVVGVGTAAHGTAAVSDDGASVEYTPDTDYVGDDSFDYTISDGKGGTATATVRVSVVLPNVAPTVSVPGTQAVPDEPVPYPIIFSVDNGNAITVGDPDADPATDIEEVTVTVTDAIGEPVEGTLKLGTTDALASVRGDETATVVISGTLNALNAALDGLTFTPPVGLESVYLILVTINDRGNAGNGNALDAKGTVPVQVGTYFAVEDSDVSTELVRVATGNVKDNDQIPAGSNPKVVLSLPPSHGMLDLKEDGKYTYTPKEGYDGPDEFHYHVKYTKPGGGIGTSNEAPVKLTVVAKQSEVAKLTSVTFVGGHDVARFDKVEELPHWSSKRQNPTPQSEYAYVRGAKLKVKATFNVSKVLAAGDNPVDILVTAKAYDDSPGGRNLRITDLFRADGTPMPVKITPGMKTFDVELIAKDAFVNAVTAFENLRINFLIVGGKDVKQSVAGTSSNPVYLTYGVPQKAPDLLDLRGKNPVYVTDHVRIPWNRASLAWGSKTDYPLTEPQDIIANIWNKFEYQDLKRPDGVPLVYYQSWESPFSAATAYGLTLLKGTAKSNNMVHNGQCTAFVALMMSALYAQGLVDAKGKAIDDPKVKAILGDDSVVPVLVRSSNAQEALKGGFLVGGWEFGKPNNNNVMYPWKNTFTADPKNLDNPTTKDENFVWGPKPGVTHTASPGQNKPRTWPAFNNHVILRVGKTWYDPSYGSFYVGDTDKARLFDFQDKSVAGFYVPPPKATEPTWFIRKPDPNAKQPDLVAVIPKFQ